VSWNTVYELKAKVVEKCDTDAKTLQMFNLLIKRVTDMVEGLKMNTAVSEFMVFTTQLKSLDKIDKTLWKDFIKLLAPFAPFLAEELWQEISGQSKFFKENSVHRQTWPRYDSSLVQEVVSSLPVQINGKLRGFVETDDKDDEESIKEKILKLEKLKPYFIGKPIRKVIFVAKKIVNVIN
jgi:leucyl-tRNA synthetase